MTRHVTYHKTVVILERVVNLSIGAVGAGLGSGYGLYPKATDGEINQVIETVSEVVKRYI